MKIYLSPKVSMIGLVLVALMLRASYWQWQRHLQKQEFIVQMQSRLEMPIEDLSTFLAKNQTARIGDFAYRRFQVSGQYDFDREMVLRNRMHGDLAGVHVLTPLKLDNSDSYIIVSRGFIPLEKAKPDQRKIWRKEGRVSFVGLAKQGSSPSWYSPKDPETGAGLSWVDAWYRVDLEKMQRQVPYPLAAFYLEVMSVVEPGKVEKEVVKAGSGREDLLLMGLKQVKDWDTNKIDSANFPIPSFDSVIPAGRHLGYVYEWAFMALITVLICLVLQLRPKRDS